MENVTIHAYEKKYHGEVAQLILDIQRMEFGVPITLEQQPDLDDIENFYQKDNGNFWVAILDGDVVGTIALIDIGNSQIALRKMFVDRNFRGKPYNTGQLLLDEALRWIQEKKCTEVFLGTLDVFEAAQRFYRRNGFEEIAKENLPVTFPKMKLDTRFFVKKISADSVRVFSYEQRYQPWFEKFNRDWIEKYFWMEPIDFQVLQYPDKHIIQTGGEILMASVDEDVAGTVALRYVEPGVYEFTKMAVDEKYRGKKIGKILANSAIEKAKALGAKKIILYSNTLLETAIQLYRKLGFREVPVDGTYKRSNIKMELLLTDER
jgi:N-acetylglutamate synthase-like GNAT family acetyltransferase